MIDVFIAITFGFIVGIFTGLLPGIHTNTVIAFLLGFYLWFSEIFSDFSFVVFIVSVGITSAFIDIIPSVFLGVPSPNSELLPLPSHKLVLQGRALDAVFLSAYARFASFFCSILSAPLIILFLTVSFEIMKGYMGFIIILILLLLFMKQKNTYSIIISLIVFFLSGVLGVITLDVIDNSLFLVFSGLFGISNLFMSLFEGNYFINQKKALFNFKLRNFFKPLFGCVFASSFINLFPGLGPSQSSTLISSFFKNMTNEDFIFIINGTAIADFVISLITFFSINKTRNGTVVFAQSFLKDISFNNLLIFLFVCLFCVSLSFILVIVLSRTFLNIFKKMNFRIINFGIIALILALSFIFSSFYGLFIVLVSSLIGLIPIFSKTPRSNCMGVLLLPYLVWFFGRV